MLFFPTGVYIYHGQPFDFPLYTHLTQNGGGGGNHYLYFYYLSLMVWVSSLLVGDADETASGDVDQFCLVNENSTIFYAPDFKLKPEIMPRTFSSFLVSHFAVFAEY